MGIPKFFGSLIKNLRRRYPKILQDHLPYREGSITSLSIDANALFHTAVAPIYGIKDFGTPRLRELLLRSDPQELAIRVHQLILDLLSQITQEVGPSQILVIAVDGMIPMAKIQQQKTRRYGAALETTLNTVFDSNAITPGTQFMIKLDNYLRRALELNYAKFGVRRILYSSYLTPGEGEHNIFEHFRNGDIPREGYHVIYGMDADLILISLVSGIDRIILARDSIKIHYLDEFKRERYLNKRDRDLQLEAERPLRRTVTGAAAGSAGDIQSSAPKREPEEYHNIYIDELRLALTAELAGRNTAIADFVLAASLLGNDFIPHPLAMTNLDKAGPKLVEVLNQVGRSLTRPDLTVDWSAFNQVLNLLAQDEARLISEVGQSQKRHPSELILESRGADGALNLETFRDFWYVNALGPRGGPAGDSVGSPGTELEFAL